MKITALNITLHYFTILQLKIQLLSKYFTVYKIRPKINFCKFLKYDIKSTFTNSLNSSKNDTFVKIQETQQKFPIGKNMIKMCEPLQPPLFFEKSRSKGGWLFRVNSPDWCPSQFFQTRTLVSKGLKNREKQQI